MKQILEGNRLRLTRSLGQNFLHDNNQLRRIADAAELKIGDLVLEIGPGLGTLTRVLLDRGAKVQAIEIDRRLCGLLDKQFRDSDTLQLIQGDALEYLREPGRDWTEWKLVSNLPYSVASPLLVQLAQASGPPERMVATVQLEVAHRLMASAGGKDFGILTLLIQLNYEIRSWFKIPASCFFPVPNVDSACMTLVRRNEPLLPPESADQFASIVKRGFSQRRKMMAKLLKEDWPAERIAAAYAAVRLPPEVRAEQVSLEQFVQLTRLLHAAEGKSDEGRNL